LLIVTYPTSIWHPRWGLPLEFRQNLWPQKTRVPGLSYGVVCVMLDLAISIFVELRLVTDKQTDRQTHDDSIYHASIASCGKKLYKYQH